MTAAKLTTGRTYDEAAVIEKFAGWVRGDETILNPLGYNVCDYFRDGRYLGPDADGVEPLFSC